jgi:hypothetical protein
VLTYQDTGSTGIGGFLDAKVRRSMLGVGLAAVQDGR